MIENFITPLVTLLLGGGGMGILFYNEKKKALAIQNERAISDIWKQICDEVQEQNKLLQTKLDRKDDKIDGLYRDLLSVKSENNTLTTKIGGLEWLKCLENSCVKRIPPRE